MLDNQLDAATAKTILDSSLRKAKHLINLMMSSRLLDYSITRTKMPLGFPRSLEVAPAWSWKCSAKMSFWTRLAPVQSMRFVYPLSLWQVFEITEKHEEVAWELFGAQFKNSMYLNMTIKRIARMIWSDLKLTTLVWHVYNSTLLMIISANWDSERTWQPKWWITGVLNNTSQNVPHVAACV